MQSAKRIPVVFSLIILFVISAASAANTHYYNLLDGLVSDPAEFKERKIAKRIVYWHRPQFTPSSSCEGGKLLILQTPAGLR